MEKYVVTTVLGGIYQFRAEFLDKGSALECGKRVSKELCEPVDVWHGGNIVEMFKRGRKY